MGSFKRPLREVLCALLSKLPQWSAESAACRHPAESVAAVRMQSPSLRPLERRAQSVRTARRVHKVEGISWSRRARSKRCEQASRGGRWITLRFKTSMTALLRTASSKWWTRGGGGSGGDSAPELPASGGSLQEQVSDRTRTWPASPVCLPIACSPSGLRRRRDTFAHPGVDEPEDILVNTSGRSKQVTNWPC